MQRDFGLKLYPQVSALIQNVRAQKSDDGYPLVIGLHRKQQQFRHLVLAKAG